MEVPGLGYKKGQDSMVKMTDDEDDGPALLDTCQVMRASVQSCHHFVVVAVHSHAASRSANVDGASQRHDVLVTLCRTITRDASTGLAG